MMKSTLVVLLSFSVAAAFAALPIEEADYLRRKWREDTAGRSTGKDALKLKAELSAAVPGWTAAEGWAMAKARAFALLCDETAIDVSPLDWFPAFAYWTRHTYKTHPMLDLVNARKAEVMEPVFRNWHPTSRYWTGYPDFDHSAPDWDTILALGFPGMKARLEKNWHETEYYPPRRLAIDAVLRLVDRLVAQGEKRLGEGVEPTVRSRLEKTVASLKRLRCGPPQTTLDALEFVYLYWVVNENFEGIQVRSLGNLDRMLTPYYRADLAAGRTTEVEFRDQLRHFWWQWGSINNYWGQPVYFGGSGKDGSTGYNEVSKILLDIHDELALPTPKLHLKIGRNTPDWLWDRSLDMARRMRPISFLGEEPHWKVIRSMGYDEELARTFMVWGCYEWAIKDSANDTFGAAVNLTGAVVDMLAEAAAGRYAAENFIAFKEEFLRRNLAAVREAMAFALKDEKYLDRINPSLMFSLATAHSVETGRDAYAGGMLHGSNTGIWLIGVGSAVDSLMGVRELAYGENEECRMKNEECRECRLSLKELGTILAKDWEGHEEMRFRIKRSKHKWGNNDPAANAVCEEMIRRLGAEINGKPNSRGGKFKSFGHVARWHYSMGAKLGATPDGRKTGEELSKNLSPVMGADTEGATALINSLACLDGRELPGDMPLDVALLPNTVAGEKGLAVMRTLVSSYFRNGGMVIQFNVHDPATLRDAQQHPEKYENLQVRVAGWNVRWNDIPKKEQDAFILRQEMIGK